MLEISNLVLSEWGISWIFSAFTTNSGAGRPGAGSRFFQIKKWFYIREIYTDMRSLPIKMASQIPKNE